MPTYSIATVEINIDRKATLIDTNVLVGAFDQLDSRHDSATIFLEASKYKFYVPVVVVIESWGVLAKRRREWATDLISWVNNPSKAELIPQDVTQFEEVEQIINSRNVDCVDAILMWMAKDITNRCGLNPPIGIATYDKTDFLKYRTNCSLRLHLLNPETDDHYEW